MRVTFRVWRQAERGTEGGFRDYAIDAEAEMSFLEALDVVNEMIVREHETYPEGPIAFDHDCREGICGMCSLVIDGVPHGPRKATTTCQLHMREYEDGDVITVEPWRARAFPVIKDLMVDRAAFDDIMQAGGYVSVSTGSAPDANSIPIGKETADEAFDYAACIGCGACVAACPNASAMLFVGAKVTHLSVLPQGQVERSDRVAAIMAVHDDAGFGGCTNHEECEAACPKEIKVDAISVLNREILRAAVRRARAGG